MTTPLLTTFNVDLLGSFRAALEDLKKKGLLTPSLTLDQLNSALSAEQKQVVQQVLDLNPEDYGVHTPFIGVEPVPADLIVVKDQRYTENGVVQTLGPKYVPGQAYEAFQRMNAAFQHSYPMRELLIESAYRSPAMQVMTFLNWCASAYGGDVAKTIRHASPPAYSQHTSATKTAIDILNVDGSPSHDHPEDFKKTVEYAWLQTHANRYGFYESWPEGNLYGMRAEPWHWQYRGTPE